MVCAGCGETLVDDGPMGWIHRDRTLQGEDGHTVCPITERK